MSGSWTMYFDGSKKNTRAGAGIVLMSPQRDKMKYVLWMNFPLPSNNEAEYEALLHGMRVARACGATRLEIYGDSNLVVQQTMNLCDAINDNMVAYREMYNILEASFEACELKHIAKGSNDEADTLENIGSTCSPIPDGVFYEVMNKCSIKSRTPAKPSTDSEDSPSIGTAYPEEIQASDNADEQQSAAQVFVVEA